MVVVIKIGAYIHGVFILCGCLYLAVVTHGEMIGESGHCVLIKLALI